MVLQPKSELEGGSKSHYQALNATAGLSNYVVTAAGMPGKLCSITKALEDCGLHQHQAAIIYKESCKQGVYIHNAQNSIVDTCAHNLNECTHNVL